MAAALARFLSIPDDPVLGRSRAAKPVLHLQKDFFQLLVIDGLHHPAEGRLAGSRIIPGAGDVAGKHDTGQFAFHERIRPNIGDAAGNGDGGQADATIKHIVSDTGDAADGVCQHGAFFERNFPDVGDASRNRNTGQAVAEKKRFDPNAGNAVRHCNAGQVGAEFERICTNAGDAARNRNACHACPRESPVSDAGNRQALMFVGMVTVQGGPL
jgi:hypothetical protein